MTASIRSAAFWSVHEEAGERRIEYFDLLT